MRLASTQHLAMVVLLSTALVAQTATAQQKKTVQVQKGVAVQKQKQAEAPQNGSRSPAASAALDIVPEGVLGFGVIRNVGELDAKVGALLQDLQVNAPGALMMVRALSGIQEGLDEKGSVVVAILPGKQEGDMPAHVLFVPVSDYKKFVAQLRPSDANAEQTEITIGGHDFSVMKKGNYAVLAPPRDADRLKDVVQAKSGGLKLPSGLAAWAGGHDAYAVATPEAIKLAISPVRQGLQQAKKSFPDNDQFKSVAAIFDVYDKLLTTIQTEITHVGIGVRIEQGTIFLDSHSVFTPDGSMAQAAKDLKGPDQSALASLPSGPYVFAFDGVFPESWMKSMSGFSAEMMRAMAAQGGKPLNDADVRKIIDGMQQSMAGMQSFAMRMGPMEPGKSLYAGMSGVMKVKNSREFLANYEKSIREMSKLFEGSENPLFKSYEISKADVGGMQALQISMDMSGMMTAVGDPNAQRMMEMMIGEGGKITVYIGAADDKTVAMGYSKEAFTATLNSAKMKGNSFAMQADVAKTIKLLPKDSQWMVFISPNGILSTAQTVMQNVAPGQRQLPPAPQLPPFVLGARMTAQGCDTSLVLPKEMLVGISNYVQMMQGQPQPGANGALPPRQLQRNDEK